VDPEHLQVRRSGDTVTVSLSGDLDMPATFRLEPYLERVTQHPGVAALELELSDVEFIDSAGLGLLLATHERLGAAGISFWLADPSPAVRRMLDLTGVADAVTLTG
jgi:anti-anti-sigma factor